LIGVDQIRLTADITALNVSAKSPAPVRLRQQHYRLYRSARGGVSGRAIEVGKKIVSRDEPIERHPARQKDR
jgi:hypothetical protein